MALEEDPSPSGPPHVLRPARQVSQPVSRAQPLAFQWLQEQVLASPRAL